MKSLVPNNPVSAGDFKRLKESFFSSEPVQETQSEKNTFKEKAVFFTILALLIGGILFLVLSQFDVIVLPPYEHTFTDAVSDMLTKKDIAALELIDPSGSAKIVKQVVHLDVPFEKKTGFGVNIYDTINMATTKLVLIIKPPTQKVELEVVLRDNRFFSNALDPIRVTIAPATRMKSYIEVPILAGENISYHLNLARIKQLRFSFSQNTQEAVHIFVKNVFFEKRR
ncbi:MAG: hypothetical protein V1727_04185 [Candidatus Omnitrophota bacterium]